MHSADSAFEFVALYFQPQEATQRTVYVYAGEKNDTAPPVLAIAVVSLRASTAKARQCLTEGGSKLGEDTTL